MEERAAADAEAAAARLSSLLALGTAANSTPPQAVTALTTLPGVDPASATAAVDNASTPIVMAPQATTAGGMPGMMQVMAAPAAGMQPVAVPATSIPVTGAPMAAAPVAAAPMAATSVQLPMNGMITVQMAAMMPLQMQQPPMQMQQQMQMQMQMQIQMQQQMQMQMQQQMQLQMQQQMQVQQMQQFQVLQMQGAGCQLPGMMPGAVAMAPTTAAAVASRKLADEDEIEPIASHTQEDINSMEHEVREAEKAARFAAKEKNSYVGVLARYSEEEGYGFISCPDTVQDWDRKDIFIASKNFAAAKIKLGDTVIFQVEKDGKALPRAMEHPKTLKELTKQKRRLARMKDLAKADNIMKRSAAVMMTAPVGAAQSGFVAFAGVPDPKRINLGPALGVPVMPVAP